MDIALLASVASEKRMTDSDVMKPEIEVYTSLLSIESSSSVCASAVIPFVPFVVDFLLLGVLLNTSRQFSQLFRSRGPRRTFAPVKEAWSTGFAPKNVVGVEDWCSLKGVKEEMVGIEERTEMLELVFIVLIESSCW